MIPFGDIVLNILEAINYVKDAPMKTRVKRLINQEYFSLCRRVSWDRLRSMTTLDFETADDTGLYLPSNLFGIDRVRDDDDEFEFYERDREDIEPDEEGYRYYTYCPSQDPAFTNTGTVRKAGTTFVCDSLTTDYTASYVKFGSEPGYYLLSAIKTFTPTYYGEDIEDGQIVIRPPETKKMVLMDRGEEILKDRSVDVYYWQAPRPLYNDWDIPILPTCVPLELMVLRRLPEAKARRPVGEAEVKNAIAEAIAMNPSAPRAPSPRDIHNRIFDVNRLSSGTNNLFGSRT